MADDILLTRQDLSQARTLVVKVGSSLLASVGGGVDADFIRSLVAQLAAQRKAGREVVLVSSGAVAAGTAEMRLPARPHDLSQVQAVAAVGQAVLMQLYRNAFAPHGIPVGQVLLTRDGLQDRARYLHARNTLRALLDLGALPVVNENDTVAVEELKLRMGDNDGLAVSVSQLVDADCLVLLTDVPGLYDGPPDAGGDLIDHVPAVTPDILAKAGGAGSEVGSGGMASKLLAAQASGHAAIPLVVADGHREAVLAAILAGETVGTFFAPRERKARARQQWIAFGRKPEGEIVVDAGARRALVEGKKSLLPIGVRAVIGSFREGDTVVVRDPENREFARGLANFSDADLRAIAGKHSDRCAAILGYACDETVIHRDNLVVLEAVDENAT